MMVLKYNFVPVKQIPVKVGVDYSFWLIGHVQGCQCVESIEHWLKNLVADFAIILYFKNQRNTRPGAQFCTAGQKHDWVKVTWVTWVPSFSYYY